MGEVGPAPLALIDSFGRTIRYMRLSVTDRCNFRCHYCRPAHDSVMCEGRDPSKQAAMSLAETVRLVRLFVALGVAHIRLTGGEPLLRRDLLPLAIALQALPGLEDLSLSTNGFLLPSLALPLRQSGVQRINISLDSLDPDAFATITRGGDLKQVLQGIDAAVTAGFQPIKINMVVMGGINDHEIPAMVTFAGQRGLMLRFIEAMPVGNEGRAIMGHFMPATVIMERIQQHFGVRSDLPYQPVTEPIGAGPARYHHIAGLGVDVGIISALSQHFCDSCNRVRLTAQGELVLCLGRSNRVDLLTLLRGGSSDQVLRDHIVAAIRQKPRQHEFDRQSSQFVAHSMPSLGG
ncbi:MAG: GTP 3',8-cyclase MoaA [Magnetococcales bacterium]|nr:GTP 3',8-cyclase MoaA [Magnetococcales bacterium]